MFDLVPPVPDPYGDGVESVGHARLAVLDDPTSDFVFGSVAIIELTGFAGLIPALRFPPNGIRYELGGGLRAQS